MFEIEWKDEKFILLPERAVYWKRTKTLLITDPHFGKETSFQKAGISIPIGSTSSDILRMEKLLLQTEAKKMIILGDFFHNQHSLSDSVLENLEQWRKRSSSLSCILIPGNHDRFLKDLPSSFEIECVEEPYFFEGFSFHHHPPKSMKEPAFAGHLHPSIEIRDSIGSRLRSPCFFFGTEIALLPAFGSFTGTFSIKPKEKDRVFVIGDQTVLELKGKKVSTLAS